MYLKKWVIADVESYVFSMEFDTFKEVIDALHECEESELEQELFFQTLKCMENSRNTSNHELSDIAIYALESLSKELASDERVRLSIRWIYRCSAYRKYHDVYTENTPISEAVANLFDMYRFFDKEQR